MAFPQSLLAVKIKLAGKLGKKQLAKLRKLQTGGFNGGSGSVAVGTGQVITTTFAPPVDPRSPIRGGFIPPPPIPRPPPFTPLVPAGPGFDPRGPQPGGLGTAACNLLSGTARDLCLLGIGFFGQPQEGGGRPALPQFPGAGPGTDITRDPGEILPGQVATVGAFGLPALSPTGVSRLVRKCGRGMVLGVDNLCYPKAVLTGRSKFRKWRRPVRPPVTRRDVVAIRRAAGARDRVKELAKDVGLKIGTSRKRAVKQHHH